MHHHSDTPNNHEPTQHNYLSGPQIIPRRVQPDMTVVELIDQQFQAYNAARLSEAARLYVEEMLNPERDVTIGMTMAG
ncbi:MAG: deoxyhypusine synthase, partial [Chloroflexi bacterium]|nr:deoxyhypusine synthase [Chloroflexota bacterium]